MKTPPDEDVRSAGRMRMGAQLYTEEWRVIYFVDTAQRVRGSLMVGGIRIILHELTLLFQ